VGAWATFGEGGLGLSTEIRKPFIAHFKKFYCGAAVFDHAPKILELALDFFGPERVLFGCDAPFGVGDGQAYITEALRFIDAMQIPQDSRGALLSNNAKQLLKIT
jgi:predicted TIM-barrel fold metal-dependent hydrolase